MAEILFDDNYSGENEQGWIKNHYGAVLNWCGIVVLILLIVVSGNINGNEIAGKIKVNEVSNEKVLFVGEYR